ncbi:hypothetical protein PCANC_07263 [Puccinia coronata f. sp. avenae]|uniref:Uncharacterized protein n=1 Tax=Puccinia coronata f. sp. avenae TaxID=200324 RepID=A0A2N5VS11_9BASI|nr:hypothetical protein PCANC_07263 [Puccinia coronata f. sp. avenae]
MVSTLLPLALLALAFSSWHLAAGFHRPPSKELRYYEIGEALEFRNTSPDYTMDRDKADKKVEILAHHFAKDSSNAVRKHVLDIENLIQFLDSANRSMFKIRIAEVMHYMLEKFDQHDKKFDILKVLYLFVGYVPSDAAYWARNVICKKNEPDLHKLASDQLDYDSTYDLLLQLDLKTVKEPVHESTWAAV